MVSYARRNISETINPVLIFRQRRLNGSPHSGFALVSISWFGTAAWKFVFLKTVDSFLLTPVGAICVKTRTFVFLRLDLNESRLFPVTDPKKKTTQKKKTKLDAQRGALITRDQTVSCNKHI